MMYSKLGLDAKSVDNTETINKIKPAEIWHAEMVTSSILEAPASLINKQYLAIFPGITRFLTAPHETKTVANSAKNIDKSSKVIFYYHWYF